jgi:hypothetical protein
LFIVWTVNPKSRLADVWPDGGLVTAVVDCGSPPQPVSVVNININNVASQKCGRIKDFMVGIVAGSPGWREGSTDVRSSPLWETATGQLNGVGSEHRAAERGTPAEDPQRGSSRWRGPVRVLG